jgi:hypothetical protein
LSRANFLMIHMLLADVESEANAVIALNPGCVGAVLKKRVLVDERRIPYPNRSRDPTVKLNCGTPPPVGRGPSLVLGIPRTSAA